MKVEQEQRQKEQDAPVLDYQAGAPKHVAVLQGMAQEVQRHPYTVISVVVLVIMGIGLISKRHAAWNEVQVEAAKLLLQGHDYFKEVPLYTYPPFSAYLDIPFTVLPDRVARAIWYLICVGSLIYLIQKSWRLAGGPTLEADAKHPHAHWREQVAFIIGNVCALQLALNALTHLQTDLLIGALILAGCGAIAQRKFLRSAIWIGIAAAFKATPLLFAPYLVYRRKWTAALLLVVVAVGANLVPDLVHRPPTGGSWLTEWSRLYLAPMGRSDYLPGDWKNQLVNNQSLSGAAKRWLVTTWESAPGEFRVYDRPSHPSPAVVRWAFYLSCLAALLPLAWVAWRRHRAGVSDVLVPIPDAPGIDPHMIECGIILLLMLLLSPNSSRAHFCIMFLPAFCAARVAVYRKPGLLAALVALAAVSSTLSIHIRLTATFAAEQFMLWLGVLMFCAIFLMLADVAALTPLVEEEPLARETRRPDEG